MDWLRLYHGTCSDPKWRIVARRAKEPVSSVLAIWLAMLECASQSEPRGVLQNWDDEDVGVMLDMDSSQVQAIREAMQGKTLEGDQLTGWSRRQPIREDGSSERAKAWRERKRTQTNANERTDEDANANERKRTQTNTEEIRGDKRRSELDAHARAPDLNDKTSAAKAKSTIAMETGLRCFEIIGWDKSDPTKNMVPVHQWIADGASPDLILETVRAVMAKKAGAPPSSLAYFTKAVTEARENEPPPELDKTQRERDLWRLRLTAYRDKNFWIGSYGPRPGSARCTAPADLVREIIGEIENAR